MERAQARGENEPWLRPSFIDEVTRVQRRRQLDASSGARVQLFDRSPVCTLALATFLGQPVSPLLAAELERITAEKVYEQRVIFVRNLGFCERTAARRISFEEALVFERIHERSHRGLGYELVDIPTGDLDRRVEAVREVIPSLSGRGGRSQGGRVHSDLRTRRGSGRTSGSGPTSRPTTACAAGSPALEVLAARLRTCR
ncbi:AAA family ATPase [Streptomyces sp. HNM0645]|uniref:ATP/GTP-binding protein n=1 Tax=Streptomyces sp. HNM0645 TaxID=2782343 RepID=UPI0024B75524|nr:AAA family ATPase [Streptomyces sp. HNM0645]MDI9884706.1 AAA family ATPase [Streptomyces sp. HNM0645]